MGTASLALQSQNVIYASKNGVLFDGSDQSGAMQELCNRALSGPVTIVLDGPAIKLKAIRLYSNTTIDGLGYGTVVNQATASSITDGFIFSNANWRSAYLGAAIVDQNITLRNMYLDGQSRNGVTGSGGTRNQTADGNEVSPIRIWGGSNINVENVYIYDNAAYAVWYANVFGGVIRDLTAIVPSALTGYVQADAGTSPFQVNGPAQDLLIENIRGACQDDFGALNAIDGNMVSGAEPTGNYPNFYYGSISRITIRGLYPTACANVIRLLSGIPGGGGATASIDQVIVDGVVGNTFMNFIIADTFTDLGTPSLGNILLKNWTINYAANGSAAETNWNNIAGNVRSFTMSGFRIGDRPSYVGPLLEFANTAAVGRLTIEDYELREDSSETSVTQPPFVIAGGAVDELALTRVNFIRNATTATSLLSVTGGAVNRIELSGVSANNISNVVAVSGGTVGGVNSTGLTHRGAGGSASIAQTGGTLSRLRAGCSDTALLASGTIASKKTDGTEDS